MARTPRWEQPSLEDFWVPQAELTKAEINEPASDVILSVGDGLLPFDEPTPPEGDVVPVAAVAAPAIPDAGGLAGFRPASQAELAPASPAGRVEANLAALDVLGRVREEHRAATPGEQAVLARYAGWGGQGVWQVLDDRRQDHEAARTRVLELLGEDEFRSAQQGTTNQHFTDLRLVQAMWSTVEQLGFTGGRVLEPGCGTGVFISQAPKGCEVTGVEIEPTTAAIASLLQPQAVIRRESFAVTNLPSGFFDLTIGNVPFSRTKLLDPVDNPGRRLSVHNHFIVKSLRLTRPGGLVAVITSSYTMDAQNGLGRAAMFDLGDLVAAVRLPNTVHRAAAGTDVLTDVLVFKRRLDGAKPGDDTWLDTLQQGFPTPGGQMETARVNSWWLAHPEAILGTPQLRTSGLGASPHGGLSLWVEPPAGGLDVVADNLRDQLVMQAEPAGGRWEPRPVEAGPGDVVQADIDLLDGTIIDRGGLRGFAQVQQGVLEPLSVPGTQTAELRSLLRLRDLTYGLLRRETAGPAGGVGDTELENQRVVLREAWQEHVDRFGPVTRMVTVGQAGREHTVAPPAVRRLLSDPRGVLVTGLEQWDEDMDAPRPAGILLGRVIKPAVPLTRVDNARDGMAAVLDQTGRLDLEQIAELMGPDVTTGQVIGELGDSIFQDPADGQWTTAARYLSGDVRAKLQAARLAAAEDPAYGRNVEALEKVMPPDLGPGDVRAKLGAVWIPERDIEAFMNSVYGRSEWSSGYTRVSKLGPSDWKIEVGTVQRQSAEELHEWGTPRMPFHRLVEQLCEGQPIIVNDQIVVTVDGKDVKKSVLNVAETLAAGEKAAQVEDRFAAWVWEDQERSGRLLKEYNRLFNSVVNRDYTEEGHRLSLPGLAACFQPHEHQLTAVARCLEEPSTGLFHEVGAGKTAEMIMACMELRRLHLATKPFVVVPNHMLLQFGSEWARMYPGAQILLADSDDTTARAKARFVAKAAMNDWDAVIMTQEAFKRIEVSPDVQERYMNAEIDQARSFLEQLKADGNTPAYTLKEVNKRLASLEEKLKGLAAHPVDKGVSWEETGCDLLVVDEIHLFKNLPVTSSSSDQAKRGSGRAVDLDMKLASLRERNPGGHILIGATGTPIANSVAECWVMQHYFRPDRLDETGLTDFDTWKTEFADSVTAMEVSGPGTQMQARTRIARFHNIPELLDMFTQFGDVKTGADLDLPIPCLAVNPASGRRETQPVLIGRNQELADYMGQLEARADAIHQKGDLTRPTPGEDNMLKVISDGRLAALDMRLRGGISGGLKIEAAADRITACWQAHRDDIFLDPTGQPSPAKGALQLVFCDSSTPKEDWNVYQGLKDALTGRGVPENQIRFIHEAGTKEQKEQLFHQCRAGQVAVLIGSSDKMGVGTNIQDRAVALWHMDAPWRPDQLKQREGRILRPGNQNPEVTIGALIVQGSTDTLMWQTIERKARFIDQIMHNTVGARTVEDIPPDSDQTALYGAFKAASSQNPDLLAEVEKQAEVARLTALRQAHATNQNDMKRTIAQDQGQLKILESNLPRLKAAAKRTIETRGDQFALTPAVSLGHINLDDPDWNRQAGRLLANGAVCHTQTEATVALGRLLGGLSRVGGPAVLCRFGGHLFTAEQQYPPEGMAPRLILAIPDAPGVTRTMFATPCDDPADPYHPLIWPIDGLVTRLRNMLDEIPQAITETTARIEELNHRIGLNETLLDQPFDRQTDLDQARAELGVIQARIAQTAGQNMIPDEPDPDSENLADKPATPAVYPPAGPGPAKPDMPKAAEQVAARPDEPGQGPEDQVAAAAAAVTEWIDGEQAVQQHDGIGQRPLATLRLRRAAGTLVAACDQAGLGGQVDETIQTSLGADGADRLDFLRRVTENWQACWSPKPAEDFFDEHVRVINVDIPQPPKL